jgi:hypothetical protein
MPADPGPIDALVPALRRLDERLAVAAAAAQAVHGTLPGEDPYRGLYVTGEQAQELLERAPAVPALAAVAPVGDESLLEVPGFRRLAEAFALTAFDLHVLLLAAAPDLDLRYERVFAFLQDDVNRRRPTPDLALCLFCASTADRAQGRQRLGSDAPLLHHRLLRLADADAGWLSRPLVAEPRVVALLLGQAGPDESLREYVRLVEPTIRVAALCASDGVRRALRGLAGEAGTPGELRLCLHGPDPTSATEAAEALAHLLRAPLLVIDAARAPEEGVDAPRIAREARLEDAVVLIAEADRLREEPDAVATLAAAARVLVLAAAEPWGRGPVVELGLGAPTAELRRRRWAAALRADGAPLSAGELRVLAGRYRLGAGAIDRAVVTARAAGRVRAAAGGSGALGAADLGAAARVGRGEELARFTRRIEPRFGWEDIVLPPDARAQLQEICDRVTQRDRVLETWDFGPRLAPGIGLTALFAGPSGTGKTMAAEVLARELSLDLFAVDLAGVISKYIGETEKNLDRIFEAAHDVDAILFFDEADALFGKRSEVRDSHDRYANVEVSYLLQKMEAYAGIAILATNLRQNLDHAFLRRLSFTIHFPFPAEDDRRRIWQSAWPGAVPMGRDVDVAALAREHRLTGGNIKNVAVGSAYLAAADGGRVTMDHVRHAVRRELQKLGKAPDRVPEAPAR